MVKTIHIRINNSPRTLCNKDVKDKDVAWTSPESYRELMDGEIQGLAACTLCVAGLSDVLAGQYGQPA